MLQFLCLLVIGLSAVKADGESRIVGGQDAVEGQFPHHVKFRHIHFEFLALYCGGSIIAERFVLTTAYCLRPPYNDTETIRVIAGDIDDKAGTEYLPDKLFLHPESDYFYRHDIGLVRVATPFTFTAYVQPIQLPTADLPIGDDDFVLSAMITGYGQNREGDHNDVENYPRVLQWMNVTGVSRSECKRLMGPKHEDTVWDECVCTINAPGTSGCYDDRGGGLITHDAKPVLIGVFSSTFLGCPSPLPDESVRVFPYLEFIRSSMEEE